MLELYTKLRNHAKYYSACKEIHTGKAAFLNGVLTKGSPIFKYIESSPCTGIHKQWEMHENGHLKMVWPSRSWQPLY